MASVLTDQEHKEACFWMDQMFKWIRDLDAQGLSPHYITAGERVYWLLSLKGSQNQPVIGVDGPDGPTIPIFPMHPRATTFPAPNDGFLRPLNGIAVVVHNPSCL